MIRLLQTAQGPFRSSGNLRATVARSRLEGRDGNFDVLSTLPKHSEHLGAHCSHRPVRTSQSFCETTNDGWSKLQQGAAAVLRHQSQQGKLGASSDDPARLHAATFSFSTASCQ
jgi:hypothetical protein